MQSRGLSGKSQQNVYTRVRRLLSFNKHRGKAVAELSRCLTELSLLTPDDPTVTLDPKPVEVEDFAKLRAAATGDDLAMVMLMINCGLYVAEVVRLKWEDLKNGCLVTRRRKRGNCLRVSVLWPETLAALEAVRKRGEHVFYAYHGGPLGTKGAELRFRKIREAAKVDVTSSQLRDGCATAMAEANTNNDLCSLVLGHRTGIKDHYVLRKPKMVAVACEAVRAKYMAAK